MRELSQRCVAPDMFEVTSIKTDRKGNKKTDLYSVDILSPLCNCKSFFYNKLRGKTLTCPHIEYIIQVLRSQDKIVKYNKEDKTHTVVE